MTTTTDVINDIKADLILQGTEYDSQILRSIHTALRELRGKRYWFLERFDGSSITTTLASEVVDLGAAISDLSVVKSIDLIADGRRYYHLEGFDLLTFDTLRQRHWYEGTLKQERPEACAYFAAQKKLYLSHKAPSAYVLPCTYYCQDATLPGVNDGSVWYDDGYEVIRAMAMYVFKRDAHGYKPSEEDGAMVRMALDALNNTNASMSIGSP